jgi:hypothetical protein
MDLVLAILLRVLLFLVIMGFACLAASWGLLKGMKPSHSVLAGTFGAILFFGVLFAFVQSGQTPGFHSLVDEILQETDKAPVPPPFSSTPEGIESYKSFCKNFVVLALPAWAAIGCVIVGILAYSISAALLSRITPKVSKPIAFRQWVVPEPMVFGLIFGGMLKLGVLWFKAESWVDILGNNFVVFFLGLYTLGGLSIVSFFLHKWRLPAVLRFFSYILLIQVLFESICAIGVLDVWFDFRKLKALPPEPAS